VKLEGEACLLRIYCGEMDKHNQKPVYETIVLRALECGLAGATVLRGPMGFGAHAWLHSAKILRLSEDLPVVIEIVEREEKINAFLPEVNRILDGGLVTVEKVKVLRHREKPSPA
jgi:uncharacterized protein